MSNSQPAPSSLSGLVSTLVPVALVAGIMVVVFLILRKSQRRQYGPRTYMLRPHERTPELPKSMFGWIGPFFKIPDTYVLNHQSIDGYLLLRFLKICTVICLVGSCLTFAVLFPIDATGGNGLTQLELVSMANITRGSGNNPRFYAHALVGWVFFGFVWFMIMRESIFYINIRQAYLLSPLYATRMSARTILISSIPNDYLDEGKLRRLFSNKVKNLWIATDCSKLEELVAERDKVAYKLEGAETKLIKMANEARLKSIKKGGHEEEHLRNDDDLARGESGSAASRWVKPKDRPTHRLKPLIGKKVDTINWCRAELERLIPEVEVMQAQHKAGEATYLNSAFIEFYTQNEAQSAFQTVAHHLPLHMSPRFIGIDPTAVIWGNLKIKWWERVVRNYATIAFIVALIVFWAIPVAFVGVLSNINVLKDQYTWLHWLNSIPSVIFGVVSGLLPAVLLSVLMALLPIILRLMAKLGGMPSNARVELRTQNFYFAFQVIQVFLVATIGSAVTAVGKEIANNPSSAATLLAQKLPSASNVYISYFIVQGLTLSSGALLQIVGLILYRVLGKLLDSTPRKMYKRFSALGGLGWGTVFPIYTLLITIAIIYSCIAPLVLGFATVGLYLLYIANRYNLLFVYNCNIDTKGLVYPRALQQLTTGIYIAIICMIGLFGIAVATGPLVLMVVFLIASILFHLSLNNAIGPLLNTLPKSLEVEEQSLLALENGETNHVHEGDKNGDIAQAGPATTNGKGLPPKQKKPNMFSKWLRPDKYTDYHTLRRMVPTDFAEIIYSAEAEKNAYYHPSISSPPPLLWIPCDTMGISRQEIAHSSKVIPMTDEGAGFNEKGKMIWNEDSQPPIFMEKIDY